MVDLKPVQLEGLLDKLDLVGQVVRCGVLSVAEQVDLCQVPVVDPTRYGFGREWLPDDLNSESVDVEEAAVQVLEG